MTFDEIVQARHSIRKYEDRPVPREMLEAVLEAGRLAPSGKNAQTWRFTAVVEPGLKKKLMHACGGQRFVAEAPCVLVVWSEGDREMFCGQSAATVDCSIALSFMMLKAVELGLGTCWLGAFSAQEVKDALGLGPQVVVVAATPLGWPAEAPAPRPRKALGEIVDIRE